MTSKIIAIQANHPSKLNPKSDTSIFLANEVQNEYKIFYYEPKDLSIINSKIKDFLLNSIINQKIFLRLLININ